MRGWTADELNRIAGAEELEIEPRKADGSFAARTPIWVVRAGDALYIRSYRG